MTSFVITEDQLLTIEMVLKQSGITIKRNVLLSEIRSCTLFDVLSRERERILTPLLKLCKDAELDNKKRCDDGVDNISSFQLRARQGAFERCGIWIEETLSREL